MQKISFGIGIAIISLFIFIGIIGPLLPHVSNEQPNIQNQLKPPSGSAIFGYDENGYNLLNRIVVGARIALVVGFFTTLFSAIMGTIIGAISGYYGGILDEVIMRIVDILMSFPGILLSISIIAITQTPSYAVVIFALSITSWVPYARLVRSQTLSLVNRDFVIAAKAMGAGDLYIIRRHIIPNCFNSIIVQATFGVAAAIIAESALSFLGIGPQDSASWGALIDSGTQYLLIRWHLAFFPGLALFITVMGINMFGDSLRDRLDPKLKI
ncbi:MAG: ABC transporter permease [Deltaproteobacteria bacterium]|nr:ABC transporter permease [Deltaproteobacteria bacterium]